MTTEGQTKPLTMPGARWIRAALQVNPFGYVGNPSPSQKFDDEHAYNEALLEVCGAEGIALIAITDHWRASTGVGLAEAAKVRGITALPGFEAISSEGIHLLVIFEAGTAIEEITIAIGACGLTSQDPHALSDKSIAEIVDEAASRGALVVPAHVNVSTSGLLHRMSGRPLEKILQSEHLHVLGITPGVAEAGDQPQILANRPPYERKHPLVAVHADDVSAPLTFASEGASTWFKMCEPSLAGLKHAVRTPETRISLTDPATTAPLLLRQISWNGGFLDGQTISFADDLTALIGGRGTGKSTVVESLRYVLDIAPIGAAAQKDHNGVVQNVLHTGTSVSLVADVAAPTPTRYTIERTVPHPPVVKDSSGTVTKLRPADVVHSLEIFGQHELAELAQDKKLMAEMVGRIAGRPIAANGRPAIVRALTENRDELARVEQSQQDLEDELADIPRLTEQAQKFAASDLGEKLAAKRRLDADEAVLDEIVRRLELVSSQTAELDVDTLLASVRAEVTDIEDSPRQVLLESARSTLITTADAVETNLRAIRDAVASAWTTVQQARADWTAAVQDEVEANDEVFRRLIADGYEPDSYITTTAQLTRLTARAEQRAVLASRRAKLLEKRDLLMAKLVENETAITQELHDAVRAVNAAASSAVVVRPVPNPDRTAIKAVITAHVRGQRGLILSAVDAPDFSVPAFVAAARDGAAALAPYKLTGAQLKGLLDAGEPLLRELEEQSVGLAVDVLLNLALKGQGTDLRRLEDLSKGQRATALLLLLLGAASSPLVIDQPEDDLDNRFIYDGIVTRLRGLKGVRQVIVSTHNANVPVLGDAELVVTLEGDGQNGRMAADGVGSLDVQTVRAYAEDLLEGGRDAFNARKHLYGF
ncbi:TrlF family AAA-like ATPase [Cellulomonas hominis]